ncbi:hypothetical protein PR048_011285 [Dryococelus australis]|uniref:Uncharacterized protein n=1 Tax=Dryococelus australis TaxID=614101 RepID=A0ABQ9HL68_9NEOP|nr:hypothetical protein PR048_011285 [Dryococelus australis]
MKLAMSRDMVGPVAISMVYHTYGPGTEASIIMRLTRVRKTTGGNSAALHRNLRPTLPSLLPGTMHSQSLDPLSWESRECRLWRDLLASQTSSRLLKFPICLATTQEYSGGTGWRLSSLRHITVKGANFVLSPCLLVTACLHGVLELAEGWVTRAIKSNEARCWALLMQASCGEIVGAEQLSVGRYKIILAGSGQTAAATAIITRPVQFVTAARLVTSYVAKPGSISGWIAPAFSHVGIVPDVVIGQRFSLVSPISPVPAFCHCSILTSFHHHQLSRLKEKLQCSSPSQNWICIRVFLSTLNQTVLVDWHHTRILD